MIEMPRSDQAISVCRGHAATSKPHSSLSDWPQVESVLASYIASTIYAEAEARLREIVTTRVGHGVDDARVKSFGRVASSRLIRSIKISEVTGILGFFEDTCKAHFNGALTPKQKTDWDSLMNARHATAHEQTDSVSNVTLSDIEGYYESVREVLQLFRTSLYIA